MFTVPEGGYSFESKLQFTPNSEETHEYSKEEDRSDEEQPKFKFADDSQDGKIEEPQFDPTSDDREDTF